MHVPIVVPRAGVGCPTCIRTAIMTEEAMFLRMFDIEHVGRQFPEMYLDRALREYDAYEVVLHNHDSRM